ncbi:methylated-DNA--[protein]-cysteine S-methyltransferase [Erysipelothrix sp. HDW6C]|uniref:methylated-DNA--[protein]-cysteine S-methyltransferase n=1 Tax=Erysipelothrix sp. HDW6C TaxID=2714930 RepID=UPI00140A6B28|nr:methylated-DNA--[protein]-cysteine S-methyltransferase [Erysipelothrix sp. HDW6C]QIK69659.1 methylated-DNA--[protein]-cysteine S-methyltransferase [Erysipelothrix sp. HDW6C]
MKYTEFKHGDLILYLVKDGDALCYLGNDIDEMHTMFPNALVSSDAFQIECEQLTEYFDGKRKAFTLDLQPKGTAFQESVWNILNSIPFGTAVTYSDVAEKLGDKKKVRAVASAIGKNPIMIITPCHRVLGKDGKLHGFRGGLAMKSTLLNHESITH